MGENPGLHRKFIYLRAEFRDFLVMSPLNQKFMKEVGVIENTEEPIDTIQYTRTTRVSAELL